MAHAVLRRAQHTVWVDLKDFLSSIVGQKLPFLFLRAFDAINLLRNGCEKFVDVALTQLEHALLHLLCLLLELFVGTRNLAEVLLSFFQTFTVTHVLGL